MYVVSQSHGVLHGPVPNPTVNQFLFETGYAARTCIFVLVPALAQKTRFSFDMPFMVIGDHACMSTTTFSVNSDLQAQLTQLPKYS